MSLSLSSAQCLDQARLLATAALRDNDLNGYTSADSLYRSALAAAPKDARAAQEYGLFLGHGGHYAGACEWLQPLVERNPGSALAPEYAHFLERAGRVPEALRVLSAMPSREAELELQRARLEALLGETRSARARLDALPGGDVRVRQQRIAVLARLGLLDEALAAQFHELELKSHLIPRRAAAEGGMQVGMVCWGKEAVRAFLELALPNQLSRGNLPDIAGEAPLVYRIYTDEDSASTLCAHPTLHALRAIASVYVDAFPSQRMVSGSGKYGLANQCHRHAVLEANVHRRAIVFLSPDSIVSEGCFARLRTWQRAGRGTVLCTGPRLTRESVLPALDAVSHRQPVRGVATLGVSARELARLVVRHMHPCMQGSYVDAGYVTDAWSCLYHAVEDNGVLARQMHLHPLLVMPDDRGALPEYTIDSTWVGEACPDRARIRVVADSDDLAAFSWSERAENADMRRYTEAPWSKTQIMAHLARRHITEFNLWLMGHRMYLHAEDLTPRWASTAAHSDALVAQLIRQLRQSNSVPTAPAEPAARAPDAQTALRHAA